MYDCDILASDLVASESSKRYAAAVVVGELSCCNDGVVAALLDALIDTDVHVREAADHSLRVLVERDCACYETVECIASGDIGQRGHVARAFLQAFERSLEERSR